MDLRGHLKIALERCAREARCCGFIDVMRCLPWRRWAPEPDTLSDTWPHRQEVERVIGEGDPPPGRPRGRTLLPGVVERDDATDVDLADSPVHEPNLLRPVLVRLQGAGQHLARVIHRPVPQIPARDVIAGVTAVAVAVEPGVPELVSGAPRLRGAALHGQRGHCGQRGGRGLRG